MDYANLKTQISDWTHRTDLAAYLDTFIDLTEAEINNKLRMSEMEDRATTTATSEYIPLPGGFLEMRNIQLNTSPVRTLEYRTPYEMDRLNQAQSGNPTRYTIIGDEIQLYPVPASAEVEITYYKSITPIDGTTTTNFVLNRFPMVYLHGCLKHAYLYARDAEGAQFHGGEFDRLINELNLQSKKRKFGGAPLSVRAA